ncbi:MAG TPA: hypothetical protein VFW15_02945 [Thermoanaerobaculia bacterium]|nr:hypothetical protein [Thermoanaerobaculia bacterium]
MKRRSSVGLTTIVLFWATWAALSGVSSANLPIQKKAKELGFPATNCQYCHNEKLPKKGAMSHNERGKWLFAEKTKRGAKEVDPAWLKEYPGDKN